MGNVKRPLFLTILLIYVSLGTVFSLYAYIDGGPELAPPQLWFNRPVLSIYAIVELIQLIGIFLVWRWKRIGFYIFLVTTLTNVLLNVVFLGGIDLVFPVIELGLLYLAMRPVWSNFK